MDALRKKGVSVQPVEIQGRKIARTFWGEAWCEHLESFSDYANRLPRGRTYVRNGSVCHLEIGKGEVVAKVAGSEIYDLRIRIQPLPAKKWNAIKQRCSGQIGSLLELLQGKLSHHVMEVVTDRKDGLFPQPREISLHCNCPDWAVMCKHVAAVLYGVGARLDQQPELLFQLRGVDHEELIDADAEAAVSAATSSSRSKRLTDNELSDVFNIDLDASLDATTATTTRTKKAKKATTSSRRRKQTKTKRSAKKAVAKTAKKKGPAKKVTKKTSKKKTARAKRRTTRKRAAKKKMGGKKGSGPTKAAAKRKPAKKAAPV
jgi:uncharacterized Zn finger protein